MFKGVANEGCHERSSAFADYSFLAFIYKKFECTGRY
jgi:hypothetical protein